MQDNLDLSRSAKAKPPTAATPKRLRRRADFLRAAKGKRFHTPCFTLQAAAQSHMEAVDETGKPPRFGFTVTKKIGNAVKRNRIRRRLKEALRLLKPLSAREGYDYVFVARSETLSAPFPALQAEIGRALSKVNEKKPARSGPAAPKSAVSKP